MFLDCLIAYLYSPTLSEEVPTSILWCHCLLLFWYQTFDAVDGKQARAAQACRASLAGARVPSEPPWYPWPPLRSCLRHKSSA